MELLLAAVFKAVLGVITATDVPLFTRSHTGWDSINQSSFLEFFTAQLAIVQSRDDYREFTGFSLIFLGQVLHRDIHLQASGPMHHARCMSEVHWSRVSRL